MSLTSAEQLLQQLGISEPNEIDLEAIAYYVGARVRYRPLEGCEARIAGYRDKAIITVNAKSSLPRRRFSIAHELGHWHYHRGQALVCRVEEYRPHHTLATERIANAYAADLLMPNYLFRPIASQQSKLTFKVVGEIANIFATSRTATAIRLMESDQFPGVLVCHGGQGRKWLMRAPSIPDDWFLRQDLDADSSAFEVLFGSKADDRVPQKIKASAWFTTREPQRHDLYEQTMRIGDDDVLTLLLFNDLARQ